MRVMPYLMIASYFDQCFSFCANFSHDASVILIAMCLLCYSLGSKSAAAIGLLLSVLYYILRLISVLLNISRHRFEFLLFLLCICMLLFLYVNDEKLKISNEQ